MSMAIMWFLSFNFFRVFRQLFILQGQHSQPSPFKAFTTLMLLQTLDSLLLSHRLILSKVVLRMLLSLIAIFLLSQLQHI